MSHNRTYREWEDVSQSVRFTAFTPFYPLLETHGITQEMAEIYFKLDYSSAVTMYDDTEIRYIFMGVWEQNRKKYEKLFAIYDAQYNPLEADEMTESYSSTRTPNLTRTGQSSATASGTIERKQTLTKTETPNQYGTTTTHSVNPYDNPGFRSETKDETIDSGTRTTTEAYTGSPDASSSTSSGSSTQTETGTETISHTLSRSGNSRYSPQELAEQEIALAERMNIFKIIEKDIARKVFLQVWI